MINQNKIIIGLLSLIVVAVGTQMVLSYQKTERKYRACLGQCQCFTRALTAAECKACNYKCDEKYGK